MPFYRSSPKHLNYIDPLVKKAWLELTQNKKEREELILAYTSHCIDKILSEYPRLALLGSPNYSQLVVGVGYYLHKYLGTRSPKELAGIKKELSRMEFWAVDLTGTLRPHTPLTKEVLRESVLSSITKTIHQKILSTHLTMQPTESASSILASIADNCIKRINEKLPADFLEGKNSTDFTNGVRYLVSKYLSQLKTPDEALLDQLIRSNCWKLNMTRGLSPNPSLGLTLDELSQIIADTVNDYSMSHKLLEQYLEEISKKNEGSDKDSGIASSPNDSPTADTSDINSEDSLHRPS